MARATIGNFVPETADAFGPTTRTASPPGKINTTGRKLHQQDNGFIEVTNRKKKGKKAVTQPNSRYNNSARFTKPKPSSYRPKMGSGCANGEPGTSKGNASSFEVLNTLDVEKIVAGNMKSNGLEGPCSSIHYFDSDGTDFDDLDQDVETAGIVVVAIRCAVFDKILNCVSANPFVGQVFSSNAKTMWDELVKSYDKVDGFDNYGVFGERYFEDYYSEDQYTISIKEDTVYPCLHSPKTTKERRPILRTQEVRYSVKMLDPNITMEEYIRLEEEKDRRCGKVYNCKTATYGKIWDNEDVHDLGSAKTGFPAIVFNDTLTSEAALSCEPTVSSLNNDEIDFRISFDESDDEDCTVIFDKNSFSYKIISVNNLKMDSENDNDKVNMPLLPSPEPTVSYFDDLDYFKDFENEFPAIVYNDAQTSKLDLLTEPILNP
ncbi:hypothetical protein Tco_0010162 [Tanacetum coccineum]